MLSHVISACRREWSLLAALGVGVAALAVQLDVAPLALAQGAVPLAMARELRAGTGLLEAMSLWPEGALAPLYPLIVSVVSRAWPAFPEGLTLLAVMDACFAAGAAWFVGVTAKQLGATRSSTALGVLLGFTPLLILLRDLRVGPYPLALLIGTAAIRLGLNKSERAVLGAGVLAGAAALVWPGAIALPLAVGASWWRRSTRVALIGALIGVIPVASWWAIVLIRFGLDPEETLLATRVGSLPSWVMWVTLAAGLVAIGPLVSRFRRVSAVLLFASVAALIGGVGFGVPEAAVATAFPWLIPLLVEWLDDGRAEGRARTFRTVWTGGVAVLALAGTVLLQRETNRWLQLSQWEGRDRIRLPQGIPGAVRLDMLAQGTIFGVEEPPVLASDLRAHLSVRLDRPVRALRRPCEDGVTHLGLVYPQAQASWLARQADVGASMEPLFEITDGPALLAVRCGH